MGKEGDLGDFEHCMTVGARWPRLFIICIVFEKQSENRSF